MAKFSLKLVASITLLTTGLVAYAPVSAGLGSGHAWAQRMQRQTEPGNPPGAPAAAQPSPRIRLPSLRLSSIPARVSEAHLRPAIKGQSPNRFLCPVRKAK